ncbi:unnamed protein product [Urochloa humidicola]
MELLEVDVAGKRLVPLGSLGSHAAFVGNTHCVLVSTETFPSIARDAIYLGYSYGAMNLGVYHVGPRRTEPPHEFDREWDRHRRAVTLIPRSRPCNLDQYLACYVDRKGRLSGACIIHAEHSYLSLLPRIEYDAYMKTA